MCPAKHDNDNRYKSIRLPRLSEYYNIFMSKTEPNNQTYQMISVSEVDQYAYTMVIVISTIGILNKVLWYGLLQRRNWIITSVLRGII